MHGGSSPGRMTAAAAPLPQLPLQMAASAPPGKASSSFAAVMAAAMAVAGVGCSLPHNSVLAGVTLVADRFGPGFFASVVAAVYAPTMVVGLAAILNSSNTASRTAWLAPAPLVVLLLSLFPNELLAAPDAAAARQVVGFSAVIGALSYVHFIKLQTLASTLPPSQRKPMQAWFAFGYQLSGFVVFVVSLAWGFDHRVTDEGVRWFYQSVAVLQIGAVACAAFVSSALSVDAVGGDDLTPATSPSPPPATWRKLGNLPRDTRACAAALFLTVFGSVAVLPLYAWFRPPTHPNFPQELFFIRLFCDAGSRLVTLALPHVLVSPRHILAASVVRLGVVLPLVSINARGASDDDVMFVSGLIAAFAFSSGFIVTRAFQVGVDVSSGGSGAAPAAVMTTAAAVPMLNLAFGAGLCAASLVGLFV